MVSSCIDGLRGAIILAVAFAGRQSACCERAARRLRCLLHAERPVRRLVPLTCVYAHGRSVVRAAACVCDMPSVAASDKSADMKSTFVPRAPVAQKCQ